MIDILFLALGDLKTYYGKLSKYKTVLKTVHRISMVILIVIFVSVFYDFIII